MTTLTQPRLTASVASASNIRTLIAKIVAAGVALGEGLAAHQRYERLRARGVPHAEAAARSFAA